MALEAIRQNLAGHEANLLTLLPDPDSMKWVSHFAAYLQSALVIGHHDECSVLAFTKRSPDQPTELCYCSIPINDDVYRSWLATDLTEDQVVENYQLIPPFKDVVGNSQHGQGMLSAVILWYFLGLSESKIRCDIKDYCPSLLKALRQIQSVQGLDTSQEPVNATVAEDEDKGPEGRTASRQTTTDEQPTPSSSRLATTEEAVPSDYSRLVTFLDGEDDTLLKSIPGPGDVKFVDLGIPLKNSLPKKLLIGSQQGTQSKIYAYMRRWGTTHRIEFYVEGDKTRTSIITSDLAPHLINDPFIRTYPEDSKFIDSIAANRLTIIVKWYFIAAGIAGNCVLEETKDFPVHLYNALLCIRGPAVYVPADSAEETLVDAAVLNCSIADKESLGIRPDYKTTRGVKRHAEDTCTDPFTRRIVHRASEVSSLYKADKNRLHEIDQIHEELETKRREIDQAHEALETEREEILAKMTKRRKGVEKFSISFDGL